MRDLRREYWSKVRKGEVSARKEKMGECFRWKANGQCSKGDSVIFYHNLILVNCQSSSASRVLTQTDGRKPRVFRAPRGVSPSGLKGWKLCKNFFGGTRTEPPCDLWHPSVCQHHKSESRCKYGDKCNFRHNGGVGCWAAQ